MGVCRNRSWHTPLFAWGGGWNAPSSPLPTTLPSPCPQLRRRKTWVSVRKGGELAVRVVVNTKLFLSSVVPFLTHRDGSRSVSLAFLLAHQVQTLGCLEALPAPATLEGGP